MGHRTFQVIPGNRCTRQRRLHAIWLTLAAFIMGLMPACTSKTDFQQAYGGPLGLYPDHALSHFTPDEQREYESQWQRRKQETKADARAE
jgi:hypothetical protein